jgi:hypothetical protein
MWHHHCVFLDLGLLLRALSIVCPALQGTLVIVTVHISQQYVMLLNTDPWQTQSHVSYVHLQHGPVSMAILIFQCVIHARLEEFAEKKGFFL